MIPIAADGVTVLQIDISCTRMGKEGNDWTKQRFQQFVKWRKIPDTTRPADTR